MLRLVEIALFLVPFTAFLAWRLLIPAGTPSLHLVAISGFLVMILAGTLLWLRREDAAPPLSAYVPSHMEGDRIVPGSRPVQ